MKKLAMLLAVAVLAFALAGCACSSSGGESADSSQSETIVKGEIAWSDASDSDAAGKDAGFTDGFVVPNPLPIGDYEWSEPHFTSMDKVAQADYDGGVIGVTIRKGEGVPLKELASDLNDYKFDWAQDVGDIKVACHGYEEGIANFIEWENDGCSYDVWCVSVVEGNLGMNEKEVAAMVAGIK